MLNAPVVSLVSAVLLAGCQTSEGPLDWRRLGNVAGATVMAGGGLLLGGPAGAAAGLEIGSNLFARSGRQTPVTRYAGARERRSVSGARSAKPQQPVPAESAEIAAAKPQEADAPKPVPFIPAAAHGGKSAEMIGI
jgi:hypothetical protein